VAASNAVYPVDRVILQSVTRPLVLMPSAKLAVPVISLRIQVDL